MVKPGQQKDKKGVPVCPKNSKILIQNKRGEKGKAEI